MLDRVDPATTRWRVLMTFRTTSRQLFAVALATVAAATMSAVHVAAAPAAVPDSGIGNVDASTPGTPSDGGHQDPHSICSGSPCGGTGIDCNNPPDGYADYCASIPVVVVRPTPAQVIAQRCRGLGPAACRSQLHWMDPAPAPPTPAQQTPPAPPPAPLFTPLHHMRPV